MHNCIQCPYRRVLSQLDKMQFVAVLFDELNYIARVYIYGSRIVTWMDTHELVLKVLVHVDYHILLLVGEDAERSDCSAYQSHLGHKILF